MVAQSFAAARVEHVLVVCTTAYIYILFDAVDTNTTKNTAGTAASFLSLLGSDSSLSTHLSTGMEVRLSWYWYVYRIVNHPEGSFCQKM